MKHWLSLTKSIATTFPDVQPTLNGPATAADLDRLEQRFGHPLPQLLRDIYLQHDGEAAVRSNMIFGLRFLPVQAVMDELDVWKSVIDGGLDDLNDACTSTPKNAIACVYAHAHWLPLFSDGGGNYIGLDFAPGPKGTVGQVINFGRDEEGKHVLAKTLDAFLALLAKVVKWKVVAYDGHGGIAVNDMHFIDAIKTINKLPSKNPEDGYYSVWIVSGPKHALPAGYFDTGHTDGRSFLKDFGLTWHSHSSSSGAGLQSGEPAPIAQLMRFQNHADKYMAALIKDAAALGIETAGYIHIVQNMVFTPHAQIAPDACARFVGCYKAA